MTTQNILMVGIDEERYQRFAPMLHRKHFDVDRFPSPQGALELVTLVPFAAIIVYFPMRDITFDDFLLVVRRQGSASRAAPIALFSSPTSLQEAQGYLTKRIQLVVCDEDPTDLIDEKVSTFLGIRARAAVRTLVKLDVALEDTKRERFMAQSKDISASGMFVASKRLYPIGSRARFEFTLPNDSNPFGGTAEVTRHSAPTDSMQGFGVKFLSFSQNSQQNLSACLDQLKR